MSNYLDPGASLRVKQFGSAPAEVEHFEEVSNENAPVVSNSLPATPLVLPNQRPKEVAPAARTCAPGFTLVNGDARLFAKEYAPKMECPNYIGGTDMLLRYLFREERKNHITMPIRACGIDPIVFENVERLDDPDNEGTKMHCFAIVEDGLNSEEGEVSADHVYELIEVDNNLYLSCMSECLDESYFHRIITEATTTMRETGSYIFKMVGLRRLAVDGTGSTGRLLETLRLNTFEMSSLCDYMSGFGVEPSFEIIDGHQCICFRDQY